MGVTERVDTIWSCKELNRMLWFRTTVDALFDMLHRSRRYGQIEESVGEPFSLKTHFSLD